jgi:hypothetical protein
LSFECIARFCLLSFWGEFFTAMLMRLFVCSFFVMSLSSFCMKIMLAA